MFRLVGDVSSWLTGSDDCGDGKADDVDRSYGLGLISILDLGVLGVRGIVIGIDWLESKE
jgi:hypothetical protein